jgi:predicted transposase YbfD/YdcC
MSTHALSHHLDWPGAGQVCRVVRRRTKNGKTTTEAAYYITSLSRRKANAEQLAKLIRDHWGRTENGVHWLRDVVFDEDRCTIFKGHSPQNWATVRNAALDLLRTLKIDRFAATIRSFTRNTSRLFSILGYVK